MVEGFPRPSDKVFGIEKVSRQLLTAKKLKPSRPGPHFASVSTSTPTPYDALTDDMLSAQLGLNSIQSSESYIQIQSYQL